MKRIMSLAALLCFAAVLPAFEGVLKMVSTVNGEGGKTMEMPMTIQIKGAKMRTDMETMGMTMATVADTAAGKVWVTNPMTGSWSERDIAKDAAKGKGKLVKKDGKKDINGYACEEWQAVGEDGVTVDLWMTTALGGWLGQLGGGKGKSDLSAATAEIAKRKLFPVMMIGHDAKGKVVSTTELKSVKKQAVPDSAFDTKGKAKNAQGGAMGMDINALMKAAQQAKQE